MNAPEFNLPNPASKARLRLWLRLLKLSRLIESDLRERLRTGFDTTLPRFDVLAALYRAREGLRMSELSGVLHVSNGNVTGIVERLVGDGLVERLSVEGDRRAMQVRLTEAGVAEFARLAAAHEDWIDELFGSVSATEVRQLIDLLQAVVDGTGDRDK